MLQRLKAGSFFKTAFKQKTGPQRNLRMASTSKEGLRPIERLTFDNAVLRNLFIDKYTGARWSDAQLLYQLK